MHAMHCQGLQMRMLSFLALLRSAISELRVPPFSFHDLQRPFCFSIFQLVGRFTFACYSDASGVMTLHEFQCAVHKMVTRQCIHKFWSMLWSFCVPKAVKLTETRRFVVCLCGEKKITPSCGKFHRFEGLRGSVDYPHRIS